jgi:hypothetical protein
MITQEDYYLISGESKKEQFGKLLKDWREESREGQENTIPKINLMHVKKIKVRVKTPNE